MVTKGTWLPSEEELTVEEVNVGTPTLRAAAFQYGKVCEDINNEFMLCRLEEQDPRKCLAEGRDVTRCALNFFRELKRNCNDELNQFTRCMYTTSIHYNPGECRNTQRIFDKCVFDSMGIDKPDYGYFCRVKVHATDRPLPDQYVPILGGEGVAPEPPRPAPQGKFPSTIPPSTFTDAKSRYM